MWYIWKNSIVFTDKTKEYLPTCHPHVPSIMHRKICLSNWILFSCCRSPSFIINLTCHLIFSGMRIGIACKNTYLYEYHCRSGTHIHIKVTCFQKDNLEEKLKRLHPLLFECNVTSHQISSGHSTNNQKAGITIQATDIKRISDTFIFLSNLSIFAFFFYGCKILDFLH